MLHGFTISIYFYVVCQIASFSVPFDTKGLKLRVFFITNAYKFFLKGVLLSCLCCKKIKIPCCLKYGYVVEQKKCLLFFVIYKHLIYVVLLSYRILHRVCRVNTKWNTHLFLKNGSKCLLPNFAVRKSMKNDFKSFHKFIFNFINVLNK